jgi:hypothetical protein
MRLHECRQQNIGLVFFLMIVTGAAPVASDEQNRTTMGPDVIVPVSMFAFIFGCVYLSVSARHKQRMALIEKGMDASMLVMPRRNMHLSLMFGMLMVGIGVGILVGMGLDHAMPAQPTEFEQHPDNPAPYFLSIMICGGAALIWHHFIVRKKE